MMDGVPSGVTVLLVESVQILSRILFMESVQSWFTGTKIARGLDWVHRYQLLFIGFTPEFLSLVPKG